MVLQRDLKLSTWAPILAPRSAAARLLTWGEVETPTPENFPSVPAGVPSGTLFERLYEIRVHLWLTSLVFTQQMETFNL